LTFNVSVKAQRDQLSHEKYLALRKAERIAISQEAKGRAAHKRKHPINKNMAVLGVESIIPKDEAAEGGKTETNNDLRQHGYGLSYTLFMSE